MWPQQFLDIEMKGQKWSFELLEAQVRGGWLASQRGWSLGVTGSGATVEIDEPSLRFSNLCIVFAGHHLYLYGPTDPEHVPDLDKYKEGPRPQVISVRIDSRPVRIGCHTVQFREVQDRSSSAPVAKWFAALWFIQQALA